jgi:hypothetical protein
MALRQRHARFQPRDDAEETGAAVGPPRIGLDRQRHRDLGVAKREHEPDPDARFVFTDPAKTPNAIPFDTFEAEFGHHGTNCTFETLCDRFGIADPAVQHIGRIVHDLDLKESTHGEPEAPTIGRLVDGLRRAQHEDDALLESGIEMFEALYQSLRTAPLTTGSAKRKRLRRRP